MLWAVCTVLNAEKWQCPDVQCIQQTLMSPGPTLLQPQVLSFMLIGRPQFVLCIGMQSPDRG